MNIARMTVPLILLAALGTTAQAQSAKTRDQVKAEWAEATRTGEVLASGDTGLKLNELYPQRFPHAPVAAAVTRAQVRADLAEAIRTGDMIAAGEGGMKLNQEFPQRYPAMIVAASGKTRAQVKSETVEAIRTGDMFAAGEGGMKLNEEFPQRYGKARGVYGRQGQEPASMVASTVAR